jgi:hypothetical protein
MKHTSIDSALRFAFEVTGESIVKSANLQMDDVHSTAPAGLSPQERHGEAVLIIRIADRLLPDDCQFYVLARYLPDPIGQSLAVAALTKEYIVPALAIKNTKMALDLSTRYFSADGRRRTSQNTIATQNGVAKSGVQYWEDKIAARIAAIAERSEGILWDEFVKNGLLDA